jgi:hypothetical protein
MSNNYRTERKFASLYAERFLIDSRTLRHAALFTVVARDGSLARRAKQSAFMLSMLSV